MPPLKISAASLDHCVIPVGGAVIKGIFYFEIFNRNGTQTGKRPAHPGMLKGFVYRGVAGCAFGGIDVVACDHRFGVEVVIVLSEVKESAGQKHRHHDQYGPNCRHLGENTMRSSYIWPK